MPATTSKRTASQARPTVVVKRAFKAPPGRSQRAAKKNDSPVIAASVHKLRFKPKPLRDILAPHIVAGVSDALKAVGKKAEVSDTNALALLESCILEKGTSYKLDVDASTCVITVYTTSEKLGEAWHAFPVGRILADTKKRNKRLHDVLVNFLAVFVGRTKIDTWYYHIDQVMEWLEMREEEIRDYEPEAGDAYKEKVTDIRNTYRDGVAANYERIFRARSDMKPENILTAAKKLRVKHAARELIVSGCEFLLKWKGQSLDQFAEMDVCIDYTGELHEMNGAGVRVQSQACMMWDLNDDVAAEINEYLDSDFQDGVQVATAYVTIRPGIKKLDIGKLKERIRYVEDLSELIKDFYELSTKC